MIGHIWRRRSSSLRAELPGILATRTDALSPRMLRILEDLTADWRRLDARIEDLSSEIEALARQDKGCERLMSVPGIGPIISSAMVAAIGTGDAFSKSRDFGEDFRVGSLKGKLVVQWWEPDKFVFLPDKDDPLTFKRSDGVFVIGRDAIGDRCLGRVDLADENGDHLREVHAIFPSTPEQLEGLMIGQPQADAMFGDVKASIKFAGPQAFCRSFQATASTPMPMTSAR
jgi:hypothetical protein